MTDWIKQQLNSLKQQNAYRSRQPLDSAQGSRVTLAGRTYLSFSSNDYLGLANDPRVVEAFIHGAKQYGVGSGASPLVTGYSHAHRALEQALAEFLECERVILFSSGYAANIGLQTALYNRQWQIFADRLNHASLIDATRFSTAHMSRYRNLDTQHLKTLLASSENELKAIVTDAVFSMDGTIAPLDRIVDLKNQYDCHLLVDDAHGFGVTGENGKGTLNHFGMNVKDVTALTGTLGKALGSSGAFIATSSDYAEYLIQKSRPLIYSTATPSAVAVATTKSLEIICSEPERHRQLQKNITRFREWAAQANLHLTDSPTPIQGIIIGGNAEVIAVSEILRKKGILITPIRPPTVPVGTARLRITLCAHHSDEDIEILISALQDTLQ